MRKSGPYSKEVWNNKLEKFNLELNDDGYNRFNEWLGKEKNPIHLISSRYKNLYKIARRMFNMEELDQIGRIALWQALLGFDPQKSELSTILTYNVLGQLSKLFRANNLDVKTKTYNNDINWELIRTNKVTSNINGKSIDEPINLLIKEEEADRLNKVLNELEVEDKNLVEGRFLAGKIWKQIENETGEKWQNLSYRLGKILDKMKYIEV